jgi:Putative adhesin
MKQKILVAISLSLLLLLAVTAIFVIAVRDVQDATGRARSQFQALQNFESGSAPILVKVNNEVGKVDVVGRAEATQVTVGATKIIHVPGTDEKDFDRLDYRVFQEGNIINVIGKPRVGINNRIEIAITLPKNATVEVRTKVGEIILHEIETPNAAYKLETDVGAITVNKVGAANLNLRSDVGAITVDNVTAGVTARSDTGEIRVRNSTLLDLNLFTAVGRIEVSGTINLNRDGQIKSDVGAITLRLNTTNLPRLDVNVGNGRITNNLYVGGFMQMNDRHFQFGNNGAKLLVTTGNGSVFLERL